MSAAWALVTSGRGQAKRLSREDRGQARLRRQPVPPPLRRAQLPQ
jgi:hypothetical protein